ncbi:Uncharacterised protein [Serratia ficaria]|uniref:Uncharacterized protein n=1 Tax=Serratia ficaria TaxID=61651 RepID=A0A240C6R3_SERFI|nr:hypothetical protein C7332_2562 [Serratia ficaria]CAI0756021.1 Uncharacterised protein [Serratia ficaria]CAI0762522.1 Uncharacterised protein [Serratia ficaria]CAI0776066.1 Uncharacterised protein [Serratia ficaria]CAI0787684.1 Uncharacterised protein [Serratia ficaria]
MKKLLVVALIVAALLYVFKTDIQVFYLKQIEFQSAR